MGLGAATQRRRLLRRTAVLIADLSQKTQVPTLSDLRELADNVMWRCRDTAGGKACGRHGMQSASPDQPTSEKSPRPWL